MLKGIFAILVIISFLLGANLFRGAEVQAAKSYSYKIKITPNDINTIAKMLNDASAEGYEYVGTVQNVVMVFKK